MAISTELSFSEIWYLGELYRLVSWRCWLSRRELRWLGNVKSSLIWSKILGRVKWYPRRVGSQLDGSLCPPYLPQLLEMQRAWAEPRKIVLTITTNKRAALESRDLNFIMLFVNCIRSFWFRYMMCFLFAKINLWETMLKNEGKVKSIFLDMSSGNKKEFHRTFDTRGTMSQKVL